MLQEEGLSLGPECGLLSNTQQWIARGNACVDKARDLIEKENLGQEWRVRETAGLLCHMAQILGFYGDWASFWVVSSLSFWLRVLSGGIYIGQSRWIPARWILEGW